MVERIGDAIEFHIVTADRDIGDYRPYASIIHGAWNSVGRAKVFYVGPGLLAPLRIVRLLLSTPYDVLYLNSVFSIRFSILPLLAHTLCLCKGVIVLGPRGEFSAGALALKRFKKRIFIAASRVLGFYRRVIWHASTEYEAGDIKSVIGQSALIRTALDLSAVGDDIPISPQSGNSLMVIFVSRISPKKNLLGAISLLSMVRRNVRFDVYGPAEDKHYLAKCLEAAAALPCNVVFTYCGVLQAADVVRTMARYDLFLFPTFGENYGHVIAEAFSAGLPVLTSDLTAWRDLQKLDLGWDLPLNRPDCFAARVEECCAKSSIAYAQWRRNIRAWAMKNIGNQEIVDANRQLFRNLTND